MYTETDYVKRAIERIDNCWVQQRFYDWHADGYCIIGALQYEHYIKNIVPNPTNNKVVSFLQKELGNQCVSVWNDEKGRKKEEILQLLYKADDHFLEIKK